MNITIMNYKILQTLLVLIFLLQTAKSVPELSLDEAVGGGSIRGSGLSQTNSMSFFTTFSIYIENSRLGCILVQYTLYPLQNSNSTLHKFSRLYKNPTTCKQCPKHGEKKRKETVFRWVKCNKHFCSFICQRPYHAVLDVNIVEE